MSFIILGDIHVGVRNSSEYFYNEQKAFFTDTLFPYLDATGIKTIIQTGDFFDDQVKINLVNWNKWKHEILQGFVDRGIQIYMVLGNHDISLKFDSKYNSPQSLLTEYSNIHVVKDFETIEIDGEKIDFVGWINKGNYEHIKKCILETTSKFCVGHFELVGFKMYRNIPSAKTGMNPDLLKHYAQVWSGHFHTRSRQGNVIYVGTPYETTWHDCDDTKGFVVVDFDNKKYTYIENPRKVHYKLTYPFDKKDFDFSRLESRLIDVLVCKRDKNTEKFVDKILSYNPKDLTTNELNDNDISEINVEDVVNSSKSTIEYLMELIDQSDFNSDKSVMKKEITGTYLDAQKKIE